jgi:hypothetical protein
VPFVAGIVLFSASLANFLNRNDYDFLRTDVALVVALFAAISAIMTPIYAGQRQWGRSVLEGLLAATFVDLNSTGALLPFGVGAGVAAFTFWKRSSLLRPMIVFGSIVLLTTIVVPQSRWSWMRTVSGDLRALSADPPPALLHIILDEHLGPEGLPLLGPEGAKLRDELKSAYVGAGFVVYGRAYSEHMHTVNAIPQVLNYDYRIGTELGQAGVKIGPTEHLKALTRSGYALKMFQSDFADICTGAVFATCTTYDSFSLRPLLGVPLTIPDRTKLIFMKFMKLSGVAKFSTFAWNRSVPYARTLGIHATGFDLTSAALTSSVASFAALDELNSQLSNARPGEAYIVHLLMPHFPYVMSRDCKPLSRSSWDWRISPSALSDKQRLYMGQVRCVTTKALKAVELFRSSPAGKNGSVIIHGDHGSRITRIDPRVDTVGRFGDDDLIAGFSTFFAIQLPDGKGGYVDNAQPIAPLVRDFSKRNFKTLPGVDPTAVRGVYLDDASWRPGMRVPMPESWVNPPRLDAKS